MAETIQNIGHGPKWHWYNVQSDLQEQGGIKNVSINPLSVDDFGCGGDYNGNPFYFSWVHNFILILSMKEFSQELVDAFSKVVEYQPFCRYEYNGMFTVEWIKDDPDASFTKIQENPDFINTIRL